MFNRAAQGAGFGLGARNAGLELEHGGALVEELAHGQRFGRRRQCRQQVGAVVADQGGQLGRDGSGGTGAQGARGVAGQVDAVGGQ